MEPLQGAEIHGFHTRADLNINRLLSEDAVTRWFRPNEVHAILSNPTLLKVQPQPPVQEPTSGSVFLYDRKVVRNFRKDGLNWKKKKDGKSVQEAHEKLKVGNEERVHVYYARGEDDPNFYRRCYWLLDKELERIVLVHYRHTSEENAFLPGEMIAGSGDLIPLPRNNLNLSPLTSDSNSFSQHSEVSGGGIVHDEFNSGNNNRAENKEFTFDEINTLEWEDLIEYPSQDNSLPNQQGDLSSMVVQANSGNTIDVKNGTFTPMSGPYNQSSGALTNHTDCSQPQKYGLQLTNLYDQAPLGLIIDPLAEPSVNQNVVFNITHVSPDWAYCTDETMILIVGDFHDQFGHLYESNLYCSIRGICVKAESIKPGVLRVFVPQNTPGPADLYITVDCQIQISQVINFTYLPDHHNPTNGIQNPNPELELKDIHLQTRLWQMLFSSNKIFSMSNKLPQKQLKEATKFASQTSPMFEKYWIGLIDQINEGKANTKSLVDIVLRNKVQEWLLEKVLEGCKMPLDKEGQGVIHLCAMLDYVWAVWLFALSGLSLDFRDAAGWTALHWAAYYGRERMVASLLSAGANPSLVADPTPDFPGGSTAADIAAKQGFEGLAAYLAEKSLTAHFEAMSLHGNVNSDTSSKLTSANKLENQYFSNISEQELCLKDSLAAYRNAADAATKIQAAFRERTLKLQTEAVQMEKPENEAEYIIAALRIQHAYRNYNRKKVMKAAARIQSHFRTWKMRRNFLTMRRHVIQIQAAFRGHRARRNYKKIIWSVGIVEKAILRWSRKKRGLRGMQSAEGTVSMRIDSNPSSSSTGDEATGEEDFFRISREQAEARFDRSVVRVQTLFRSYKAQQEYRRMKMAHEEAQKQFEVGSQGDWAI